MSMLSELKFQEKNEKLFFKYRRINEVRELQSLFEALFEELTLELLYASLICFRKHFLRWNLYFMEVWAERLKSKFIFVYSIFVYSINRRSHRLKNTFQVFIKIKSFLFLFYRSKYQKIMYKIAK